MFVFFTSPVLSGHKSLTNHALLGISSMTAALLYRINKGPLHLVEKKKAGNEQYKGNTDTDGPGNHGHGAAAGKHPAGASTTKDMGLLQRSICHLGLTIREAG